MEKTETVTSSTAIQRQLLAMRCQLGEREAFDELVREWHLPLLEISSAAGEE